MFHLGDHAVGIDDRVKKIQTELQADKRTWQCAWLHGQAGMGKTTLARALFNQLSAGFQLAAAVGFQRGDDGENQLMKHMSEVLHSLRGSAGSSTNLYELSRELKDFVKSKKVLLLLDDVCTVRQFELFLPEEFGEGSVVVVTSRSDGFERSSAWKQMRSSLHIYKVDALDAADAKELLQRYAGNAQPDSLSAETMKEIWIACDGRPLLLKPIIEYMRHKDIQTWQGLDLSGYTSIEALPPNVFDALPRLQALNLSGCTSLSSLPESITQLAFLEDLNISGCSALKSIAALAPFHDQRNSLKQVNLSGCTAILGPLPEVLWRIETLDLSGCSRVTRLPVWTKDSKETRLLQRLDLSGCSLLEVADCTDCTQLMEISLRGCSSLRSLDLHGCIRLSASINQVQAIHVSALQEVNLSGTKVQEIPSFVGGLPILQSLRVQDCDELRVVFLHSCKNLAYVSFSGCKQLTSITIVQCEALILLDELVGGNDLLEELDLSGCKKLTRLPHTLLQLQSLHKLDLSKCERLTQLPVYMGQMKALKTLKLACCYDLVSLPQTIGGCVETIDLSYCQEIHTLAGSLVKLRPYLLKAGTEAGTELKLKLDGWDELTTVSSCGQGQQGPAGKQGQQGMQRGLQFTLEMLHHACVIRRLVDDHAMTLELLARLSWLATLLGAATFTAALAPPGGYDNGLLFLGYNNRDCLANSSSTNLTTSTHCSTLSILTNCSSFTNSGSSCIQAAGHCTDNVDCTVKPRADLLRAFFVLDLLSFGLCMTLVVFALVCSIRHSSGRRTPFQTAGLVWLSLAVASLLLFLAVLLGMLALLAGVLSVYPKAMVADVLAPCLLIMFLVGGMFYLLVQRWWSIFPGWDSFRQGLAVLDTHLRPT